MLQLARDGAQPSNLLTKQEAYRIYGRSVVDRWLSEGLIKCTTNGKSNKPLMERNVLAAVAAASNRITYLPVADRK